jgi:release factor glutamine methyltransferase
MTVREWLRLAESRLRDAGIESPRLEAQVLGGHVLLVDRPWLLAHGEEPFPELAGEVLLQRREAREPLAYILGRREFYGRDFSITPAVLIPRQETETLIEVALNGPKAQKVLDVGTGSGILAITYKLERPDVEVVAVDISPDALEVASRNAADLGADVRFVHSDGFSALENEAFDLILTNPPYVGVHEPLMPEVRDHEPALALYSGESGMEFYELLAAQTGRHLTEGGRLLMEVGYRQAQAVASLFREQGWPEAVLHNDLSGVQRVVEVRKLPLGRRGEGL